MVNARHKTKCTYKRDIPLLQPGCNDCYGEPGVDKGKVSMSWIFVKNKTREEVTKAPKRNYSVTV